MIWVDNHENNNMSVYCTLDCYPQPCGSSLATPCTCPAACRPLPSASLSSLWITSQWSPRVRTIVVYTNNLCAKEDAHYLEWAATSSPSPCLCFLIARRSRTFSAYCFSWSRDLIASVVRPRDQATDWLQIRLRLPFPFPPREDNGTSSLAGWGAGEGSNASFLFSLWLHVYCQLLLLLFMPHATFEYVVAVFLSFYFHWLIRRRWSFDFNAQHFRVRFLGNWFSSILQRFSIISLLLQEYLNLLIRFVTQYRRQAL